MNILKLPGVGAGCSYCWDVGFFFPKERIRMFFFEIPLH